MTVQIQENYLFWKEGLIEVRKMYEQFPIDSFLLYLCEMLQISWETKPLYFSPDFVSKSQSKGSKRLQQLFRPVYCNILFRMSKEKSNLYDRERLQRLHKSFILCCSSIWKKTVIQSLLWFRSYSWQSRGFFKSLKLHFDICNILIYNKMSIKWTDLHCRLL